ncbi:MAG: quinoprotein dehydrogenase-associated putative transporter substrate-binding protein [Massilia sp.]|nr:quinoprotein dehydrogenase-associated putative transporter substrate-binding protein [Massilia sp.]
MSAVKALAGAAVAALVLTATAAQAAEPPPQPQPVLRVCQDPNNLPFSNRDLQGFENKIAALLAADLGWTIEYTWYPQRMGFIRNTLRAKNPDSDTFKCDLVTGVAAGFDMGATTRPYYRSTYAMAYVKGKGFDGVHTLEDLLTLSPDKRAALRLGVFGGSPVADWLLENGLIDKMVSYQAQSGDAERYPGEMVEKDLANGAIDVAFIWGPIAGYFARQATAVPIAAIPLKPHPGVQFEFDIVMAVRFGEAAYKQRIDEAIERNRPQINAILAQYGVPLLGVRERAAAR